MNLQENIRRILREEISNRGKDKLIHMIKTLGFDKTSKAIGGIDNLKKITGIHNSYQFMKLFLGLTPKESEDDPETILYKNDEGVNVFLYTYLDDDKDNVYMFYLNYDLVYKPLGIFRETKLDGQKLEFLQKWLKSNYNIKVNEWDIDNYRPGDNLEYLN